MAARKTSIAVPAELLREVDHAAQQRGESRNRFVVRVLAQAVRAKRDAEITRRLNELFADEQMQHEQLEGARQLEEASSTWSDEQW